MSKLIIPYVEFYIINTCNLACPGCNRFNDYNFTGYQRWADYADVYTRWSSVVQPRSIGLLGGEPLLNPDFMLWVQGISALWPQTKLRIISNGFRLHRVPELYATLLKNRNVELWIGIHNKQHKQHIVQTVKDFGQAPHRVEFNTDNPYQQYMVVTDANGVQIRVEYNWWFHQGAIVKQDNAITLHKSDPVAAHDICHMKTCHHFVRGKLYKCGVAALLPEFNAQHPLALDNDDQTLLNSYRPLSIDDENKAEFIANLSNPIPQCKFCPQAYQGQQIYAKQKKEL